MIITGIFPSDGEKEIIIVNEEKEKFRITLSDAKENGLYGIGESELPFEFDGDDVLLLLSEKLKAIKYCTYLLSFSDKSASQLRQKLREKEYSTDAANEALRVLCEAGLVDDDTVALRKAQILAKSKLYGPYRIKMELCAKGFSRECAEEALAQLDVDFDENLLVLISKLNCNGKYDLENRDVLMKFKAKLQRYGYSTESINRVLRDTYE